MKKKYLSLAKQFEILGLQLLTLGFCAQPAICAGPAYIPGYYGNSSSILPPAATALPSGEKIISGIDSIVRSGSNMTVHQGKPRAVIHWQNFDIGSQASVHFDQQSSSWKALNRVTGNGYSQIFGNLTAKGQVYILNQNGIYFGSGSQVNVHSLTASALNLKDDDFLNLPDFSQGGKETYTYDPSFANDATVSNHGTITAGELGSVFLIGPQVENNGTITARGGHAGLFAGDRVEISQDVFAEFTFNVEDGVTSGTATNFAVTLDADKNEVGGKIITERGWAGMHGSFVNQEGLIRAVTALEKNGRIELKATNRIRTGATSRTEVLVSDSGERKTIDPATFKQSEIKISATEGTIEHYGLISAPGGDVSLTARDRVILEAGSTIDVSGSWVGLTAEDRLVEVQLNSEELRDAFVYKDGPLKGEKVLVDVITGLSIADISGYLDSMKKSAPELTTKGGTINLVASGENGEVIVKEGATLDFSGGGLVYDEGFFPTTKVRIGNAIYDLQDVPAGVPIDQVLGTFSKKHQRYGLTDEWNGLYYGGSSPYLSYLPSFTQGADGGSLSISGRKIILDGTLNASVVRGIYQDLLEDPTDENGNRAAIGRRAPRAGTLQIGDTPSLAEYSDLTTDAIVFKSQVAPTSVSGDQVLPDHEDTIRFSELSADTLNGAGLGTLKLYANTTIDVEADVRLTLAELGEVDFVAQNIEHRGSIRIPSGTVNLTLRGIDFNGIERRGITLPDVRDRIFLANNSLIDVSGQRLDNSATALGTPLQAGFTYGGTINLVDNNADSDGEVILAAGSALNVSGGYMIDGDHKLKGGKAGSLSLKGNTVRPDGELIGLALEGKEGGRLSIHADEVTIARSAPSLPYDFGADDELPVNLQGHLVLAENRFIDSGFSHIALKSEGDLLVEEGVSLAPSSTRLAAPALGKTGYRLGVSDTVTVLPEYFGPNSLTLAAGQTLYTNRQGVIDIGKDAALTVAPGDGAITLTGKNGVTVSGSLTARGGSIDISAAATGDVVLTSSATVDASGTTLLDLENSLPRVALNHSVVDGGTVSLSAKGDVVLEPGSLVDVSGSEAVTNLTVDDKRKIVATTTASAAGSVSVTYQNAFIGNGQIQGSSLFSWLPGGAMVVAKTSNTPLTVDEQQVAEWQKSGFDDFTFSSRREIDFLESAQDNDHIVTIAADRGLSLNGSALVGSDGQSISLSAPWLRLSNMILDTTSDPQNERTFGTVQQGTAYLALSGDFIDIQGNVALSGFAATTMQSKHDLRLYDYYYSSPQKGWSGALRTAGDLTLQAAAIYPGMHHSIGNRENQENTHIVYPSSFTISSGLTEADGSIKQGKGGTITILAAEDSVRQTIYSAGGRLTLLAGNIDHRGVLAAPMGEIELKAENRIALADDSVLSTRGEGMTLYGLLQDEQWTAGGYIDNNTPFPQVVVSAAPEKSVQVSAGIITQASDAVIDVGGGGSIFAYEFLPGYDGSFNPLGAEGRYVILPDNSVILPGRTVYLEETAGLASGFYSLLPAEYAFLPGALVIEESGKTMRPGEQFVTPTGYTMIAGYESDRAISGVSPLRSGYIIRDAADVLAEGNFDTRSIVAGNAGQTSLSGSSMILAGLFRGDALAGYRGGGLTLGGENIIVGSTASLFDTDWLHNLSFDTTLPAELVGKLLLDTGKIRNSGLRSLQLGDDTTKNLTLSAGTTIDDIEQVDMKAADAIVLQQGAHIHARGAAPGEQGILTLTTNTLYGTDDTLLHATDLLTFNIDNLSVATFTGAIQVDHGTFQVNSEDLYLEPFAYTGPRWDEGFHLSSSLLDTFKSIDHVILAGRDDMVFLGNVNLAAKADLTLDSTRFVVDNSLTTDPTWGPPMVYPYTVNINAGRTLRLLNSNTASTKNDPFTSNTINLTAETISFGPGDLQFDTFNGVHFASSGETIFNGTGSLTADLADGGQLTFSASRYLSAMTRESHTNTDGSTSLSFTPSDFTIDGLDGDIFMAGNGRGGSSAMAMPGSLTVAGGSIELDQAIFNMPGGTLNFQAARNIVAASTNIQARGELLNFPITVGGLLYNNFIALAGGQVTMQSESGQIRLDSASTIDTSAESGLDGGTILLSAHEGGVVLEGSIKGDRIALDTNRIDDFSALSRTIAAGGFAKLVDLRAGSGDILLQYADTIATNHFRLSADQGGVDIWGTIEASGQNEGGTVEIYAADDLTLQATGRILAQGAGANGMGGSVYLASANGGVRTVGLPPEYGGGSVIDVSGAGNGGTVTFRASRDSIRNNATLLEGEIRGAAEKNTTAFRVYEDTSVTLTDVTQYMNDINAEWPILQALWQYGDINLIPEIEVRSSGNMTLASGLDNLSSLTAVMPNGTPGVFTFRAANNLNVTANIIDLPQSTSRIKDEQTNKYTYVPEPDGLRDSWDLNFIAGADMTSARMLAVREGTGNFIVGTKGNGKLIYSESGDITFVAGNDAIIHALKTSGSGTTVPELYMPGTNRYNVASFDGNISGRVGGNLLLEGGIIQTAVSDIELQVRNNVTINDYNKQYGAIRTTGRAPLVKEVPELELFLNDPDYSSILDSLALERFWDYRDGGNITLAAGGDFTGKVDQPNDMGWYYIYNDLPTAYNLGLKKVEKLGAAYGMSGSYNGSISGHATHGIATMAGGSVYLQAEDIYGQVGAFGHGDLTIYARGKLDGRFLANDGDMHLTSLADFGKISDSTTIKDTLIELGSGNLAIQALGNVSLGTICNAAFSSLKNSWLLTYSTNALVSIHSALGDAVFSGRQEFVKSDNYYRYYLLPSSLDVIAGRDISFNLKRSNPFILAPSADGQLSLIAGRDIDGKKNSSLATYTNSQILMSAADPAIVYGNQGTAQNTNKEIGLLKYSNTVPSPLHADNATAVVIKSGRDIVNMSVSVPKRAEISAGRDIRELEYWGQNLHKNDISFVSAGRNLIQQPYEGTNFSSGSLGIYQAGHGYLLVRAGGEIDLGSTAGIQSTGNDIGSGYVNSALFKDSDRDSFNRYKGADIAVLSGYSLEPSNEILAAFFDALTEKGREFSLLMATGDQEDENKAARLKQDMLESIINPLLAGRQSGSGNVAMTQSTIKTTSGQDNLYILSAGQIDVGTSIISTDKDTSKGLLTEGGGSINVFAENDINVNESRVVTYFGGPIFMLSNHGDINAGRGSATSVSPMADGYTDVGGKLVPEFSAPAPGSGIRTLTADPDGAGPITEPEQGGITLLAWEGVIDAGEAGISAANIILAATQIMNSENISFSDSGVGVPVTAEAGPSLGALAGASTISESQTTTQSIGQQVIDSGNKLAETVSKMAESLNVKMLVFKLEGFSDELLSKPE